MSCNRPTYPSKEAASKAMNVLVKIRRGTKFTLEQAACPTCGSWHIATDKRDPS